MLRFYLTIDTELSAAHFRRHGHAGMEDNFARAILGRTPTGDFGIAYQMAVLDDHGLKGCFFVDPMPALVCGLDVVKRLIDPILTQGHDVQLHAHSEWLAFADPASSPTGGRIGRNLRDFSLADQCAILEFAADRLVVAGAPTPLAFRAGNYGANDDTLRALAVLGIRYDSSFPPGIARSDCAIDLPLETVAPVRRLGVIEVPIAAIGAAGGGRRHGQVTAISARELQAALDHGVAQGRSGLTLVSHSFELLCRRRLRKNRVVAQRFDRMCATVAAHPGVASGTYADHPPPDPLGSDGRGGVAPHDPVRTALRLGEQLLANMPLQNLARRFLGADGARIDPGTADRSQI
jgi:hypothetical protein